MKKFYYGFIFSLFLLTSIFLYQTIFQKQEYYQQMYEEKTNRYVQSLSRPRGRILDCKGNVLVDNIGIKAIVYRKNNYIDTEKELEIAKELAMVLTMDQNPSLLDLKNYWIVTHQKDADALITQEEYDLYEQRKLNSQDLYLLKLDRITEDMLNTFSAIEKKVALLYHLMNEGYYYEAKLIKLEVSESENAQILEKKLSGITSEMYFKREYPYGSTLRGLFGTVGPIFEEEKEKYLNLGYSLNDQIGISYLEEQYEPFLKGEKDVYKVENDGTLTLVKEGKRGHDLVLSIDIHMQLGLEQIVKEQIKEGKKLKNTEYYHGSYVLVGTPLDGQLKAIVGLQYLGNDVFKNVESDVLTKSFTVGSIVKGASMAMAYQNKLVEVGKKIKDSCVKLYLVPEKCSYKSLGMIDDITALKTSSNYYQFLLAIKLAGYTYKPNLKMQVSEKEFSIYRDAFSLFGLGVKTGIDLPYEQTGMKGKTIAPDLLLNLAIGQYDTYTPLELLQYINTIATSGVRYKLSLMDKILDTDGNVVLKQEKTILSTFALEQTYFDRIHTGFYQVLNGGTGSGYVDVNLKAAGKTGTSETIYDSNQDGVGDVETINNTFAFYAPVESPKYSMVVVSPNVSHYNGTTNYFAYINRYISKSASDYVFKNF